MNTVVIGLGSMGKRRIRLLKQYIIEESFEEKNWKVIGIDSNQERCKECGNLLGIETYRSLEETLKNNKLDCAIISTSPNTHAQIIRECLLADLHVFTELNLIDEGYSENIELAQKKQKVLFLSSTFMYRKEVEYIKKRVQEVFFKGMYHYHIGQYLPDWHPWESYKDYFVGQRETNACREIMAVELPWIVDTFGEIIDFCAKHKKLTDLDIDYDDSYQIMLEHETGAIGCLMVDVTTPRTGRKLELWQEKFCISWEGTPDTMQEYNREIEAMVPVVVYKSVDHEQGYSQFIIENAYYDELVNFFDTITKKTESRYSFEKDKEILALIDKIEK